MGEERKMSSNSKRILFVPADQAACGVFRMYQPYYALKRNEKEDDEIKFYLYDELFKNDTTSVLAINDMSEFDAVVFQRVASPRLLGVINELKSTNTKIYIELDDALFNVHPSNPAATVWAPGTPSWDALKKAIEVCDKLILSTEELKLAYMGKEAVIIPNAIDDKLPIYSAENNRRKELPTDKTIVGWAGSTSHITSLKYMAKPIKKLMKERDDVIFAMCSNPEFLNAFDVPKEKKVYVQHKPIDEFPPVMSLFDINLAVTPMDIFNDRKSELKVLEAGIWGIPSVCSATAPYKRFNKLSDGGNICVWDNSVNDFVRAITKLIDDKETYKKLSEKTLNTVKTTYNLDEINKKRIEFFKSELL